MVMLDQTGENMNLGIFWYYDGLFVFSSMFLSFECMWRVHPVASVLSPARISDILHPATYLNCTYSLLVELHPVYSLSV